MKKQRLTRREFLQVSGTVLLSVPILGLAACDQATGLSTASPSPATKRLRLGWWGSEPRHIKYNELADLYETLNPEIFLVREFMEWEPYWQQFATQAAEGTVPDILHMHPNFLHDYGNRGTLLDLTPLVESGQIDLRHFPQGIIDSGKIGETIYMITLGNSAPGTHYNPVLFEQVGVDLLASTWTWDDFIQTAITLSEALGRDVYGSTDQGGWVHTLLTFVRQRGKTLFVNGEELGFGKEDLWACWHVWQELHRAGAVPPPEMSAEFGPSHEDSMLVKRMVPMHFMSGNQHKLYQAHIDDELGLAVLPRGTSPDALPGDVVGGAYIALAANTQYVDEGAAFIYWFVNDPEVAKIYNAEHGPPGSTEMQAVVKPQLEPADQRLAEMMAIVGPTAGTNSIRPPGGTEVLQAFSRIYQELAFKQMTLKQAVDTFFAEAEAILSFR